jgi:hypothetical protein
MYAEKDGSIISSSKNGSTLKMWQFIRHSDKIFHRNRHPNSELNSFYVRRSEQRLGNSYGEVAF